ncbi:unannotated protein [freshwater metagenome]|uniref:Unannotated protein n=1 Tax=freshwater metagenome TaxID=449393 RepID=A0A6J7EVF8_9ZZZZ|nr:hypothetical protein [Actinomycetota bacterium]
MTTAADPTEAWIAADLYDPSSPNSAERLELLRWISSLGISIDQMVAAKASGALRSLPGDMALRPGPRRSLREIATIIGTTVESLNDIRRASGFAPVDPDEVAFTPGDIEMFRGFNNAAAIFSRDELLHFSRVLGTSLRRIADAAGEMFLLDVEAPLVSEPATGELELAHKIHDAVLMVESAIAVFEPMFRAHLEQSLQATRRARGDSTDYSTIPLAIGFVDLTGFTSQTEQLSPGEVLDLVLTFEARACDLVADHGGRVVKLIGDEVMFTAVDAEAACVIALGLLAEVGADNAPNARGGLAYGSVIAHGGDLYGETVNRASRLADIAVPGEVLVDGEVVGRADERHFQPAGRRQLKGFREPVALWSLTAEATGEL